MVEQLMYGYNPATLTSQAMDWETMRTDGWHSAVLDKNITMGGLTTTQHDTRHRYASFYANAGYTYSNKYNLTGSIRWDEADLFGVNTNDQHHPLWSVGAGWNISEEDFMRPVTWLDYLKLRATYGVNGNVDQSSTTYFVATYKTQSNPVKTQYLKYDDDDLPNPDLRWEKTATTNFGVDFAVLDNRINGSIDYYNRHASDLLVRKYMDPTVGPKSHVINNGEMRNRGIELTLNATIYKNRDWNIGATLTYAHNSNKMLAVDHSESDYASLFILSPTNYLWQGTSYNTLWAYTYSRTVNGYPVIKDENGNEMATFDEQGNVTSVTTSSSLKGTAALRNMGTLTPTYNGSLNLHVGWRGLELNAFFVYAGGNERVCPLPTLRPGMLLPMTSPTGGAQRTTCRASISTWTKRRRPTPVRSRSGEATAMCRWPTPTTSSCGPSPWPTRCPHSGRVRSIWDRHASRFRSTISSPPARPDTISTRKATA